MRERVQLLDEMGAQLARSLAEIEAQARDRSRRRAPARIAAVTACACVLLVGTAYAVPLTRGTVDSITGSLSGWVQGDDSSAPGRAVVDGDNAPSWLKEHPGETRVIAEAEGVNLFVTRTERDGVAGITFGLGPGLGISNSLDGWRQELGERALFVLRGPVAFGPRDLLDDQGRAPLLGITTRDVTRLELRYADNGPSLASENGDGGFVLLVDAWRPLRDLVAYDATGRALGRTDLTNYDLGYLCEREPGCPPERQRAAQP
jgi:hypothetical protein